MDGFPETHEQVVNATKHPSKQGIRHYHYRKMYDTHTLYEYLPHFLVEGGTSVKRHLIFTRNDKPEDSEAPQGHGTLHPA